MTFGLRLCLKDMTFELRLCLKDMTFGLKDMFGLLCLKDMTFELRLCLKDMTFGLRLCLKDMTFELQLDPSQGHYPLDPANTGNHNKLKQACTPHSPDLFNEILQSH